MTVAATCASAPIAPSADLKARPRLWGHLPPRPSSFSPPAPPFSSSSSSSCFSSRRAAAGRFLVPPDGRLRPARLPARFRFARSLARTLPRRRRRLPPPRALVSLRGFPAWPSPCLPACPLPPAATSLCELRRERRCCCCESPRAGLELPLARQPELQQRHAARASARRGRPSSPVCPPARGGRTDGRALARGRAFGRPRHRP